MHLLLAGTFGIKFLSILLFMLGVCEVLIRIQQMSLNNYAVKDLSPFYFSASSIVTGAGGIMIVDNQFINFLNFASVINVLTSLISSRIAWGKYSQLNRLKACSTYQPNITSESCLTSYDNTSSILTAPVIIINHETTPPAANITDSLIVPESITISDEPIDYELDGYESEDNNDVSSTPVLYESPMHHHISNSYYNNDTNTTYVVSEYLHEVQCYGDSDYFLSAYYCEFYQIARNNERKDYCYCVTDATMDPHTTCFEYKLYPFCGDLLEQLPILTRSTYIVSTICWVLSFLLTCILCIITQKSHGHISLSVLFYFKEYSERVVPHKVAVAQYAGSDIVMADVVEIRPGEEVEMTGTGASSHAAAAVQEGLDGGSESLNKSRGDITPGRDLLAEPPPLNDDLVREFDALLPSEGPAGGGLNSGSGTEPPSTSSTQPGTYSSVPTSEGPNRGFSSPSARGDAALNNSTGTVASPRMLPTSSGVAVVIASPVAAARNLMRFSSRVAPMDADMDIAPIAPIQAFEL